MRLSSLRVPLLRGLFLVLLAASLGCAPDTGREGGPDAQVYDAEGRLLGAVARPSSPPNLIVVVIDSLRHDAFANPDHEGAEGEARRQRMPFLSELAARGVSFENATTSAPWTLPAMMSLFTGLLPSEHGQYVVHADWHLPGAITTFPEILSHAYGYRTAAFVNGPWFERSKKSLLQGFDRIKTTYTLQDLETLDGWARERDPEQPFLLVLHTFDAHDPYGAENHPWPVPQFDAPPPVDPALLADDADPRALFRATTLSSDARLSLGVQRGHTLGSEIQKYRYHGYPSAPDLALAAELETAYWAGVRWTDGLLRTAVEQMEENGLLDNTVLVVTADHGEAFSEHDNLGHGLWLYDEVTRIPMVVVGPPPFQGGRVVHGQVGLTDLFPTFLDHARLAPLSSATGQSALPALQGRPGCRAVVSEERLSQANTGMAKDAVRLSARTPAWKYIVTFDLETGVVHEEAYDLRADPGEKADLGGGKGRLEPTIPFDACMCEAITRLRARIWSEEPTGDEGAGAIPYGSAAPRARSLPPAPCVPRE